MKDNSNLITWVSCYGCQLKVVNNNYFLFIMFFQSHQLGQFQFMNNRHFFFIVLFLGSSKA
jgi:hypothetical protein